MIMFFNRLALFVFASVALLGAAASADDRVWSAVVLASKAKKGEAPKPPPSDLAPFAARLAKFFGYDQFEILGSATKTMDDQTERWLVPTQNFWLSANATRGDGGYRMHLEFFHDKRRLVETDAVLGPKSPLFVRGPMCSRGQLLLVFEVRP